MNSPNHSSHDLSALDTLTGGALTAPTSSERLHRVREWLNTGPSLEALQQVFKELSSRDKGAAKPVKEKIDDMRRAKNQDALSHEWADKAQALLNTNRLNVADAMAWARDAAKAGAPLSREPLAGLRSALADRVAHIESLSHRAQVLRESSLLMAQRIDVLSTKAWTDAVLAQAGLQADLARFDEEWQALGQDPHWPSVDPKFPPMLQEASQHIHLVWDAFGAALTQTQAAANDPQLPLPAVPAWADQLKVLREALSPGLTTASPHATEAVDPEEAQAKAQAKAEARAQAVAKVTALVQSLETDLAQGHSKATSQEAAALRQALKTHAKAIPKELEATAQAALARAGELEGWQRWRADQLRESLVAKAEALLQAQPTAVTESASPDEAVAEPAWTPVINGRKLQETLRELREAWKQTDQGGQPNHALWKRFDQACNKAYPFVQAWLEKTKAETQAHRAQRQALLAEVAAWTQAHATDTDWKKQARELHAFSERWRGSGHVSEKVFAELQTQWKAAMSAAHAGLEQAQKASIEQRRQMIEEAKQWANAPVLKVDAIKALQQRWQTESQAVPLDRKQAQKLWDAFRQPLDEAFARKSQARTQHAQALSAHDQQVMQAAEQLEAAVAKGDAMAIREAMQQLNLTDPACDQLRDRLQTMLQTQIQDAQTGLADPDPEAVERQLREAGRGAAQGREARPDDQRDRDDADPVPALGQAGDRNAEDGVEQLVDDLFFRPHELFRRQAKDRIQLIAMRRTHAHGFGGELRAQFHNFGDFHCLPRLQPQRAERREDH